MRHYKQQAFTLIEILTVMVIILILAGLVIAVARSAETKGRRSRAQNEIAAMSAGCESYKADNGVYPDDGTSAGGTYTKGNTATLDARTQGNPANYLTASRVLYRALSGDRNCDGVVNSADGLLDLSGTPLVPVPTAPPAPAVYVPFTSSQLQTTGAVVTGLLDSFRKSYGYSTAYQGDIYLNVTPPTHGYNPTYDLWSTSANTVNPANVGTAADTVTPTWIKNW